MREVYFYYEEAENAPILKYIEVIHLARMDRVTHLKVLYPVYNENNTNLR